MIVVKPAKSYFLMEEVFKYQNADKPLKSRLKGAHLELMKALVRLWKIEVGRYQIFGHKAAGGQAAPGDSPTLRTLRTNTKQLHKMVHRCERTVRNLLNRLEAHGWIKKVFHGSNASYEIAINTDLLHLQNTNAKNAENVSDFFQNPLATLRQFLPDTLSRVTRQVTKELNELGLATPDAPAASPAATTDDATQQQQGTSLETQTGYHPSNEAPAEHKQETTPTKKVPRKKVPPAKRPETMEAVTAHLSDRDRERLPRYLDAIWDHAFCELDEWMPAYLTGSEAKRGRIALAEFFVYGCPSKWDAAQAQFLHRIDLTYGWCDRRTAAGKLNTFIPIPSVWFDVRNTDGFRRSQKWFKVEKHTRKVWDLQSIVTKCVTKYNRAVDSAKGNPEETLRTIRQYLEKKGGAKLFALFTNKIHTSESINAPQA